MKLKELESYLQQLDTFNEPKVNLEQYATTPHIASHMLYTMDKSFDDLQGKVIADFGCGCGVLSIGAAMLGGCVLSIDVDKDAIEIAKGNRDEFELDNIEFVQFDLTQDVIPLTSRKFDIVIMNPPFGTKNNKGVDMKFLQKAISVASKSVYSLHKTSTREYVLNKAKEWNTFPKVLAELRYDLPKTYKFHRKQSLDIAVDFIKFDLQN